MARTAKTLTLAQVKKLPPGRHAVGGPVSGLTVEVGRSGARRWKLRRYVGGVQRLFDLGAWEDLPTLEAAQGMAKAISDSIDVNVQAAAKGKRGRAAAKPAPPADNPFLGPGGRELLGVPE